MSVMRLGGARWLAGEDGEVWLVTEEAERHVCAGRWSGGPLTDRMPIGIAMGGWDAAVDAEGHPWVVWSDQAGDAAEVFAVRREAGAWSARLQVSVGGVNTQPGVTPDEFGNVWVVWHRSPEDELWMCRMGPRSGREIRVAERAGSGPVALAAREGRLYAAYLDTEGTFSAVDGSETEGFGRPIDLG